MGVCSEAFASLSNGTRISHPDWYRKAAQRRVSRRLKGSARSCKGVKALAKAHLTVRRQRADVHHKTAFALVRVLDARYHEDAQMANRVRKTPACQERWRRWLEHVPEYPMRQ